MTVAINDNVRLEQRRAKLLRYQQEQKPIFDVEKKTNVQNNSDVSCNLWDNDAKALLLNTTQKMGINSYAPTVLKDDNTAIARSQKHLFDLIKYYEGDKYYYYEAVTTPYKDAYGTSTCGFGELTNKSMTSTQAYDAMCKKLGKAAGEVKNVLNKKIGKGTYEALPNSIKEALVDLCYNKGLGKISGNVALMSAIKAKDYSGIVKNSVYVYSGKKDAAKIENPGLWRRSLNRAILALRDLKGEELKQAKQEVENIHKRALACHNKNKVSTIELEKIYEQYKNGKISSAPISAKSYKLHIDESFKGKGMYRVALNAYQNLGDTDVTFEKFYQELQKINNNPKELKIGQDLKIPYVKEGQVLFKSNNTTTVKTPAIKAEPKQPDKKEKGFWAKLWDGVKNVFSKIGGFFSNWYNKLVGDTTKTDDSDVKKLFKKMLPNMTDVKKCGDLYVLSEDYKVEKGDNLCRLSQKYDVLESVICDVNNISDKNKIAEGQTIKIQKLGYKVQGGDNLFRLSKKFGLTVEILKDLNNIEDVDKIQAGAALEIPGFEYEVKQGDTLDKIAGKFGVKSDILKQINNLDNDKITKGQKIVVIYNNADYDVSADRKTVSVDKSTNTRKETIDMSKTYNLSKRPLLRKKIKVNGSVVATMEELKPTAKGKLSGKTIIINAGHGYGQSGLDCGAPGQRGMESEWLLNYDNSMSLSNKLRRQGANVIFLQGQKRLVEKEIVKFKKADMFISVHVNSHTPKAGQKNSVKDKTMFFYRDKQVSGAPRQNSIKLAKIMEKNFDKWIPKNETIAEKDRFMQEETITDKNGKQKKVLVQDYALTATNDERTGILKTPLNSNKIPGIIWEVGFMSTEKGRERLADSSLISNYADVMTQSVIEYFN